MKPHRPYTLLFFALALATLGAVLPASGQIADDVYLVHLTDKTWGDGYPFNLEEPEAYLSDRSLARRLRQGIPMDSLDLPVSPEILQALEALPDWQVVHASKWMSTVTLAARDSTADSLAVLDLPFVASLKRTRPLFPTPRPTADTKKDETKSLLPTTAYGQGWTALEQLNAPSLHALGFDGSGMWIAVLDAGFQGADELPAFERLSEDDRLVVPSGANVAFGGNNVFAHSRHGASVLGTMGCAWTDSLVGTAPGATYFCYVTEDVTQERRIEEEHWIVAAEHADSVGVDLMNTSLGYSLFDDTTSHHAVEDLNGITARISVASSIAASRGILVVTSAGNNGDDPWRAITFPADASNILAVGAVRSNGNHGWFSGFGPSADGRIKPDVMALGVSTPYPRFDGTVGRGNGTSFASPILCGAAASLWQAHPAATAQEVRQAILESAHLYTAPNDSMGYGIPDMWRAHELLMNEHASADASQVALKVFPNPVASDGTLRWELFGSEWTEFLESDHVLWRVTSASGTRVAEGTLPVWKTPELRGHIELSPLGLASGRYVLTLCDPDGAWNVSAPCVVAATP